MEDRKTEKDGLENGAARGQSVAPCYAIHPCPSHIVLDAVIDALEREQKFYRQVAVGYCLKHKDAISSAWNNMVSVSDCAADLAYEWRLPKKFERPSLKKHLQAGICQGVHEL